MKKIILTTFAAVSTLFASDSITGNWNTGKENSIVFIQKNESGRYVGTLVSSELLLVRKYCGIFHMLTENGGDQFMSLKEEWYVMRLFPVKAIHFFLRSMLDLEQKKCIGYV